ncbi:hypothetical protein BCR43DRAFT_491753 [Syncephalastrum racemosum]|uniref:Homeobox domain-containing protein n=1 Tax=Syncephalastrum racemosum TaxID=13706 RepID=A0A1X2HCF6_SYNRA|nr:hypothetical protein BCR43DRAFT_491753 [Syncephalastrum racemosum]
MSTIQEQQTIDPWASHASGDLNLSLTASSSPSSSSVSSQEDQFLFQQQPQQFQSQHLQHHPQPASSQQQRHQPDVQGSGQQQHANGGTKNKAPMKGRKRTRATAEQLSVLEDTFSTNVSPNAKLRKQLSERLGMSERSIQIWFQNRRAKVKHMQKRAQMQMHQAAIRAQLYAHHYDPVWARRAQSADICMAPGWKSMYFDDSNRQSMPPQAQHHPFPNQHPPLPNSCSIPTLVPAPEAGPTVMLSQQFSVPPQQPWMDDMFALTASTPPPASSLFSTSPPSTTTAGTNASAAAAAVAAFTPDIVFMGANSLCIGTWQRLLALDLPDLVCSYRPAYRTFVWYISDGGLEFQVRTPLEAVQAIEQTQSAIHFHLVIAPTFYLKKDDGWIQCADFTESKQASHSFRHTIQGDAQQLKQDLLSLAQACPETQPLLQFDDPSLPQNIAAFDEFFIP